jgi:PIN domain nuclease of toxin-antitoxin system
LRLLLDTHIFIWWAGESARLSPTILSYLRDKGNSLVLSVASTWEMQIKAQMGKLDLGLPLSELIESQRRTNGVEVLPVGVEHVLALDRLPQHHKDPFDRMLVAQSIVEETTLVSVDPVFAAYPVPVLG